MKILFFHPDLGIGGAERLIVDCALACQELKHNVHIITNHHDPNHCFEETKTKLSVQVVGDWFPRSMFGKFYALFAYIRMIISAIYLILFSRSNEKLDDCDVIILDQISAPIPLLKWFSSFYTSKSNFKIIFYCHHPDLLLTDRQTIGKQLYRKVIDWIEERTTGYADLILVNSKYTGQIFRQTFERLNDKSIYVLYPICNFNALDEDCSSHLDEFNLVIKNKFNEKDEFVFLSINRYERKKQISLAIDAFDLLKNRLNSTGKKVKLIIAGGYDSRVKENIEYYEELNKLVETLDLSNSVLFLRSPPDFIKSLLLDYCDCVLYTPENEHFGIVPIEAMYKCRPVIACKSGGPLETIVNNKTGYLCDSNAKSFSDAMLRLVNQPNLVDEMGSKGHDYVKSKFHQKHLNHV